MMLLVARRVAGLRDLLRKRAAALFRRLPV